MKNPFTRGKSHEVEPERPAPKVEDSFMARVWKSPADYNRAARRTARLWGRIWKWDPNAQGYVERPPRYARRHYRPDLFVAPKTRRQRRHRARILRIMRASA
jgi:hypothetical protein